MNTNGLSLVRPILRAIALLFGILALGALSTTHSQAARGRPFIAQGTVRSDQGTLLRGPFIKLVNRTIYTVGSSSPTLYTAAYWQPYKDLGFNNVRIVVAWGSSYPGFNATTTLQALDELVAIFSSLDMYVTICGSANDYNWFHKADLQNQWNNIAPRYKDNPNVLYEIQNEPMGDPNGHFSTVSPPKGTSFDLVAIYQTMRAAAPDTVIGMWGFSCLGDSYNDALWAIQAHDPSGSISYSKTAVAFHYYSPTQPAYVAALKNAYPVWMTEGSDEAPGDSTNVDLAWYLDCEVKGISWNSMDFEDTLQKCITIRNYLFANGYGWIPDAEIPAPAHRWTLDEAAGTLATDSAGGKHGTLTAGGTWAPSGGRFGGAYANSALWQRISVPSLSLTGKFTVAAWVKVGSGATTSQVIFSNRDNGIPNRDGCSFYLQPSDRKLRFYTANGSANSVVTSTAALAPDAWQHVAVTVDTSTGACRLYLNGTDVTGTGAMLGGYHTTGAVSLGNYYDGGWGQLTGSLDEVAIYTATLNAAQIAVLASGNTGGGATPPGIGTDPYDAAADLGQTATFTAVATGTGPLSFQWRRNGANIPGATGATYTTPAVTAADNGAGYRCVVTNSVGSAVSAAATLYLRASSLTLANAGFESPATGTFISNPSGAGWSFTGTSGVERNGSTWGAANAPEGVQAAFLQGKTGSTLGSISQSVSLAPGTYLLSFRAANRAGYSPQPVSVKLGGATIGTYTPVSSQFNVITPPALTISSAGSYTVTLAATNGSDNRTAFIDGVSLVQLASLVPPAAHWWELDESSGTLAADSIGGKNGTLNGGGAWSPAGGMYGGAYTNSALWQRISVPTLNLTSQYTLAAWVKVGATASTNRVVFSNRDNGTANRAGVSLFIHSSDRKLRFYTANGSANRVVAATTPLTADTWQHVAVTVNNSTATCKLYLNGVDVTGSGSILTGAPTSASATLANYLDGGWGQLTGSLDDVAIFTSALNPSQVGALYLGQ